MIVDYKRPNVLTIGAKRETDPAPFRFMPGINTIEKKVWDEIMKDPFMKAKVKRGEIEVISENDGREVTDGIPPADIVAKMVDFLKLEELLTCGDHQVESAAKRRLQELNKPEAELEKAKAEAAKNKQ